MDKGRIDKAMKTSWFIPRDLLVIYSSWFSWFIPRDLFMMYSWLFPREIFMIYSSWLTHDLFLMSYSWFILISPHDFGAWLWITEIVGWLLSCFTIKIVIISWYIIMIIIIIMSYYVIVITNNFFYFSFIWLWSWITDYG